MNDERPKGFVPSIPTTQTVLVIIYTRLRTTFGKPGGARRASRKWAGANVKRSTCFWLNLMAIEGPRQGFHPFFYPPLTLFPILAC
jgi:hypothetical protein